MASRRCLECGGIYDETAALNEPQIGLQEHQRSDYHLERRTQLQDAALNMPPDEFVLVGKVVDAALGEPDERGHPVIVLTLDAEACGSLAGWAATQLLGQDITLDVRRFSIPQMMPRG